VPFGYEPGDPVDAAMSWQVTSMTPPGDRGEHGEADQPPRGTGGRHHRAEGDGVDRGEPDPCY
jgi:hypothetical protein